MSLLIKGMEMPKDGRLFAVIINSATGEVMRPKADGSYAVVDGAKAVPVPPHGDLIDHDAYRDEFMDGVYELCNDDTDNYRANAIIDLFDTAPTIIEAEEEKYELL